MAAVKMKVVFERGTNWITTNGSAWMRNKYDKEYVDTFGDVWLKPHCHSTNLYVTVVEPSLYFTVSDGGLVEV